MCIEEEHILVILLDHFAATKTRITINQNIYQVKQINKKLKTQHHSKQNQKITQKPFETQKITTAKTENTSIYNCKSTMHKKIRN
jgi:hypothetical protein